MSAAGELQWSRTRVGQRLLLGERAFFKHLGGVVAQQVRTCVHVRLVCVRQSPGQ